jgi:hypothetical protein
VAACEPPGEIPGTARDLRLSSGTRLGPYEIAGQIGAGGTGEAHRARDTKPGRDVPLKALPEAFAGDAERMGRFERAGAFPPFSEY